MSEDVYFLQVDADDAHEMEKIAHDLSDFLQRREAETIVVPEKIEPLDRDEAVAYLEELAKALDVEVVNDDSS